MNGRKPEIRGQRPEIRGRRLEAGGLRSTIRSLGSAGKAALACGLGSLLAILPATAQTNATPMAPAPATSAPPTAAVAKLPTVDELMSNLLARLPSKPVTLTGELLTSAETGETSRLTITIQLRYPREATYTIGDAFGQPLEQLTVLRDGSRVSYLYLTGDPLAGAPAPGLDQPVQHTALSWMDLTLGFLWWNGGKIIGQAENRGQTCYVLDRHAPVHAMAPYASMRLWVDTRVSMLMEAVGHNKLGEPFRRLSVKSFKKINHEWMVKDLEVENLVSRASTILRIRDAEPGKEGNP